MSQSQYQLCEIEGCEDFATFNVTRILVDGGVQELSVCYAHTYSDEEDASNDS